MNVPVNLYGAFGLFGLAIALVAVRWPINLDHRSQCVVVRRIRASAVTGNELRAGKRKADIDLEIDFLYT